MNAPTPTTRDAHAVIRQIAEYAEAIASQAGVGSSETAGVIVSFLWHRPSLMHEFMAGTLSTVDLGMFDHHNGLLSWHGRDGKIYEPDPSKARVAAPAIEPLPDRNALESIPADGGTGKALEWCDRAERSEWAFMAKMLREAIDYIAPVNLSGLGVAEGIAKSRSKEGWRKKATGAGPVGEAVADEGWQPIETAPTGGKFGCFLMLAFGPPGDQTVSEGMHFQGRFYAASVFYTGGPQDTKQFTFREHEVKPTHWRHTLATPGAARPVEGPGEVERQRGWIYFNPDAGIEWAENHPVESGEVHDAEDIRPGTSGELLNELLPAWRDLAAETSRRDAAEAALAESEQNAQGLASDLAGTQAELAEARKSLEKVEATARHVFVDDKPLIYTRAIRTDCPEFLALRAALTGDAQERGR